MYTDGVSEAMDGNGEQFTEEHLLDILKKSAGQPAQEMIRRVQKELELHTKGTPQSDDITMLVLKAL
jgi:phosphoserine phosphatase RsbU/P